ncbi:NADPH-dependent F420 reductase [Yoonia vestfoldensis]|uniref:NADPH-dependent F420 reductase n=1 Tax=Yoonia vestfoldensis TaxID=245188 RepID=UPI0003A3FE21|nr:NADPH-dependent F420 reductase [Yoonia vestfoldensis]
MKIAIIGTGSLGSAIAGGLAGHGHQVTLGTRAVGAPALLAMAARVGAAVATPRDAAEQAEIVFLALPWHVAEAAVANLGDLDGKIVVDCMNPLGMVDGGLSLTVGHTISGAEIVARWLPDACLVKALNQVGAEMVARNDHLDHRPAMLMAGDDSGAKALIAEILIQLGFDPLDAGDLRKARLLEPFAMTWINLALFNGKGRDWAFGVINGTARVPR